ncbi:hypothetical protein PGT21_017615 [Puccinia graminis f. sp. tritici]|uniref:Secreted protein n=1 Tax=Puccinia graminis f. sp. tritici TaxID=56615 RepID=A0A5B0MHU9_PUCGR|nr:hypothetical protein PGT21_017615 [Puccinia graminis f. sp. tritici]KAA1126917.1 hypothetical protein PGTUg99_031643 [Puccinia graminis f. sp. tritici]
MRLAKTWIQATFVTISLLAILGLQPSQTMNMNLCQAWGLAKKVTKHIPDGSDVDSQQLAYIVSEAVSKDPELLCNDELFSAKVKEVCQQLEEASLPACGHDQSSTIKGKKGTKVCSQWVAGALAHVWQYATMCHWGMKTLTCWQKSTQAWKPILHTKKQRKSSYLYHDSPKGP